MSIRSTILALALGCLAAGCFGEDSSVDDPTTGTEESFSSSKWQCKNVIALVSCVGIIANVPVTIDIKNTRVLNNNEINVLTVDLNKLSVADQNEVNINKILNDVEVTVLNDFLNKFKIIVTATDINVCTTVLGALLCK